MLDKLENTLYNGHMDLEESLNRAKIQGDSLDKFLDNSYFRQFSNKSQHFSLIPSMGKGGKILIYQKIIEYCEKKNLNVSSFEKKCGLTNGTVNGWKNGSKPSLDSLQKIESATKIKVQKWIE